MLVDVFVLLAMVALLLPLSWLQILKNDLVLCVQLTLTFAFEVAPAGSLLVCKN